MNITKYRLQIGNNIVAVQCAAHLKEQAEWLLRTLKDFQFQGKLIDDGVKEQIGWSTITLRKRGSELLVCEPDFWGDPFTNLREDITCTLTILAKQDKLLTKLGVEAVPTTFDEKVTLAYRCLDAQRIYLEREQTKTSSDSGWYMDTPEKSFIDSGREVMYVYQLLDYRPELLQVLSLPLGYFVAFDGNRISSIVNIENEIVWGSIEQKIDSRRERSNAIANL